MTKIGERATGGLVKVSVVTGGSGYTNPPTVLVNGASTHGGAKCYSVLKGSSVEDVIVTLAGTGMATAVISFSGGGGSGAAATADVYTGPLRPMSFFRGRRNDLYGVDGMGRGVRWDGVNAVTTIGIGRPSRLQPPTAVGAANTDKQFIANVQVVKSGVGYQSIPQVAITENAAVPAKAVAILRSGMVNAVRITDPGSGYTATPTVRFSGGIGGNASFGVTCVGQVTALRITNVGAGYTTNGGGAINVTISGERGLTGFSARPRLLDGALFDLELLSGGTGMTATAGNQTPPTITIGGNNTLQATAEAVMQWSVSNVSVINNGTGYFTPPFITLRPDPADSSAITGALTCSVNSAGNISAVTVENGGRYSMVPTALIVNTEAAAVATLARPLFGKYRCAIRYLDDTPADQGGPMASSISELVDVDCEQGRASLTWAIDTADLEPRVKAIELWRTTADQSVILFRVGTMYKTGASWSAVPADAMTDDELKDPRRSQYAMMPVTLPSGQSNARRFEIPPGEFGTAVMFQDRAWYAVDTTGKRPNALMYSEIDEPESVPPANELIVQENSGTPDKIVALIPFATDLLIAQQSHLYKLSYVSQPTIDASIMLVSYRGAINSRCWDTLGGVVYLADDYGMYAFDGSSEEAISIPVDDYWRNGIIDFQKADKFHVQADIAARVVRFYYCKHADQEPVRALCFCISTKAWWEETFPVAVTAGCRARVGSAQAAVSCTSSGTVLKQGGFSDGNMPIPYAFRTGPLSLSDADGSRSVSFIYKPTAAANTLNLQLHYNNSPSPRPNAIASNPGTGFVATENNSNSALDLRANRSALQESNGYAKAYFSGRADDRSSGGDRHIAVAISGSQAGDSVKVFGIGVEGAG